MTTARGNGKCGGGMFDHGNGKRGGGNYVAGNGSFDVGGNGYFDVSGNGNLDVGGGNFNIGGRQVRRRQIRRRPRQRNQRCFAPPFLLPLSPSFQILHSLRSIFSCSLPPLV